MAAPHRHRHRPSSGCLSHVFSVCFVWVADRGQTVSVVSSAYLPPHGDTRRRAPCEFFHLAETNNETPRRSKGHRLLACLCFRVRTFEPAYGGQPEDDSSATLSFKFKEVPLTSERRATRVRDYDNTYILLRVTRRPRELKAASGITVLCLVVRDTIPPMSSRRLPPAEWQVSTRRSRPAASYIMHHGPAVRLSYSNTPRRSSNTSNYCQCHSLGGLEKNQCHSSWVLGLAQAACTCLPIRRDSFWGGSHCSPQAGNQHSNFGRNSRPAYTRPDADFMRSRARKPHP